MSGKRYILRSSTGEIQISPDDARYIRCEFMQHRIFQGRNLFCSRHSSIETFTSEQVKGMIGRLDEVDLWYVLRHSSPPRSLLYLLPFLSRCRESGFTANWER